MSNYKVTVLGAGLAGCEAALWLAGRGVQVELYEQKPTHFSPACLLYTSDAADEG